MSESTRNRNEATTIIQKFIKGSPNEIPPVPLVFGISATPDRFTSLIQSAGRTNRPVDVPPEDVRESGLIKDVITLWHPPKEAEHSDMTMLRAAVSAWQGYTRGWEEYCNAQTEAIVRPILLIQVQDGSGKQLSKTDLAEVIKVVRSVAGNLETDSLAHSFQEGTRVTVGDHEIRYLSPPDVQTDSDVRVVFFKTSLNTGWDCPRAEVMVSFRTATDATLIAQLVGRMVRTPLARRIESDESLNKVVLYLPHYDEKGLQSVIERLTKPDADIMPSLDVRLGKESISLRRADGSEKSFEALAGLPSYEIPRARKSSQVKRLMKLARLLAHDDIDDKAPEKATKKLLDTLKAEYGARKRTKNFKALVEDKAKVEVRGLNFSVGTDLVAEGETVELTVSPENLDDMFEAAGRKLGEGLHKAWWRSRVGEDATVREKAKLEFIALCFLESDVLGRVESVSRDMVQTWLSSFKGSISALPEGQKKEYDEIRRKASEPEERTLDHPQVIESRKEAQSFKGHLFVDAKGSFPCNLNTWEKKVIDAELSKGAVGWLRNPDRKNWSLCVPYKSGGEWKGLYPDFLIVRAEGKNLVVDILDPHTLSLEDAPAKAVGLAEYAEKHGDKFGRIELIIVEGDKMKRLDLADEQVRNKVKQVSTHEHLRQLFDAT